MVYQLETKRLIMEFSYKKRLLLSQHASQDKHALNTVGDMIATDSTYLVDVCFHVDYVYENVLYHRYLYLLRAVTLTVKYVFNIVEM
jgi:hypothetical protein